MSDKSVKTRFAPSPTGLIHFGNVRTALFNALFAWHHQGSFLLRMEDTDAERSTQEFAEQLMADLQWLGLQWQEGPGTEGEHAPYVQSQRSETYARYYQQLETEGSAYPCFCTPEELERSRRLQRISGQAPRYAGTCAHLKPEEITRKLEEGRVPSLRFRVKRGEQVRFDDLVRGPQVFQSDDIGDFIIRRADGTPAFFFCNAVDDSLMGVTHVMRGEDHLTNTPRQLMILQALGLREPHYGHISMILGSDGSPLSKRNGSLSLKELRESGWLPASINNYLSRLGHSFGSESLHSLEELSGHFTLERLGRAPARFDTHQLQHWQQNAVLGMSTEELLSWIDSEITDTVPAELQQDFAVTVHPNILFPKDAKAWAQRLFAEQAELDEDALAEIKAAGSEFFTQAANILQASGTDWKILGNELKAVSGKKGKGLFMPLRSALTGLTHGPEMTRVLPLLGVERAQQRFLKAAELATG